MGNFWRTIKGTKAKTRANRDYGFPVLLCKAVSEFAATATDTAVAKGVAKDILYFTTCWRWDPAVDKAVAVAASLDTA